MLFITIGAIVGFVLTLTGSGGAILAIPMLVKWGHITLSNATIVALPIVAISALIPTVISKTKPNWRVLTGIVIAAIPSSYLVTFIKPYLPSSWILVSIITLSIWAIYSVWAPEKESNSSLQKSNGGHYILIGVIVGTLTTLTGLGGGILLVPLLRRIIGLPLNKANATSLGIILIIVTSSFLMQISVVQHELSKSIIIDLIFGVLLANMGANLLLGKCSELCQAIIRKAFFTLVVIISIILLAI